MTSEDKIQCVMDYLDTLIFVIEDKEALIALAKVDALRKMTARMLKDSVLLLQDAKDAVNDHIQPDTCILPVDNVLVLLNDLAELETRWETGEAIYPAADKDDMSTNRSGSQDLILPIIRGVLTSPFATLPL